MPVQELFTFADLPAVRSSPAAVRQKFQEHYGGANPDGISVNSETYYDAVKPAITEQYGHPCYKALGQINYQPTNGRQPKSAVVGQAYAINKSNKDAEVAVTIQGSWEEATSWSSETTTGLTLSQSFTLEGVFELGSEFSLSTTVGESKSKQEGRSSSVTTTVTVPAMSRARVNLVGTVQEEAMTFTAPIAVQGVFGANFPDRVSPNDSEPGHYFWFLSAQEVLPQTTGEITGIIKHTSVFDTQTEIGAIEPLT